MKKHTKQVRANRSAGTVKNQAPQSGAHAISVEEGTRLAMKQLLVWAKQWTQSRLSQAATAKGVRRRGLLAKVKWFERFQVEVQAVLDSENLLEAAKAFNDWHDKVWLNQSLRQDCDGLEDLVLNGLPMRKVVSWMVFKEWALVQWMRGQGMPCRGMRIRTPAAS